MVRKGGSMQTTWTESAVHLLASEPDCLCSRVLFRDYTPPDIKIWYHMWWVLLGSLPRCTVLPHWGQTIKAKKIPHQTIVLGELVPHMIPNSIVLRSTPPPQREKTWEIFSCKTTSQKLKIGRSTNKEYLGPFLSVQGVEDKTFNINTALAW